MKITKALARAVKYFVAIEKADNFMEAHKAFIEKLEAYQKEENLTDDEANDNIMAAVSLLQK